MSKGPHSKLRRAARLAAVQALYQMDLRMKSSSLTSSKALLSIRKISTKVLQPIFLKNGHSNG